jgi:ABC-type amino acid transport substrate-binding protein
VKGVSRVVAGLAVALAVALLLPGCFSNDDGGAVGSGTGPATASLGSRVPPAVRRRGTLRVGMVAGRPPFAVLDPGSSTAKGADVDLVTQVASSLGLKLEVTNEADATAGAADLSGDKVDVVMAGTLDTPEARNGVDLIDYVAADQGSAPVAMAVPAAQPGLKVALMAALKAMVADRRYEAILSRWNLAPRALPVITVNGTPP